MSQASSLSALRLLCALGVRRARRGRLIWFSGAVLALPVAGALTALLSGHAGAAFFEEQLGLFVRFLAPFVMALHAASSVAEEVQGKTITYLFSRPIPRWVLPLGKYLGALALTAALLLTSLVAVYLLSGLGEPGALAAGLTLLVRGTAALLLAALLYGALATAFGTMVTSHPFPVALIYLLVVEVGFALIPGWPKLLAMSVHLRAIAGIYRPEVSLLISDPDLSAIVALPVVLVMTALWLLIAVGWVSTTEYRTDK